MFRKFGAALFALLVIPVAHAWDTDWSPGDHKKDISGLCTLMEYGGGKYAFSTETALKRALGNEGAKQEIDKLNAQFGMGRVVRFLAVADYMVEASWRACSLHFGSEYTPFSGSGISELARGGMNDGQFSSERKWSEMLGLGLHNSIMRSVDERFGEGAGANFHTIMDQLYLDLKDKL